MYDMYFVYDVGKWGKRPCLLANENMKFAMTYMDASAGTRWSDLFPTLDLG